MASALQPSLAVHVGHLLPCMMADPLRLAFAVAAMVRELEAGAGGDDRLLLLAGMFGVSLLDAQEAGRDWLDTVTELGLLDELAYLSSTPLTDSMSP